MFTCGLVSGSLRTLYYSTRNAHFVPVYSQDTVSYGVNVKYATVEYYGLSLGFSDILKSGISHNDDHLIAECLSGCNSSPVPKAETHKSW